MTTPNAWRPVPLLALSLALLAPACADRHARGSERDDEDEPDAALSDSKGTASAARPEVDAARLNVVLEDERVHVIGERGAVTPGAIEVEVQWVEAEVLVRGDVAADGSFDVTIDGWVFERYRVQAVRRSPLARSAPVFVMRTASGTVAGTEDDSAPAASEPEVCSELDLQLNQRFYWPDIGGRCLRDSDCTVVTQEGCGESCWAASVPRGSEAVVEAGYAAVRESLCRDYARAGCSFGAAPFTGCDFTQIEPRCLDGACTSCSAETCADLELCQQCPWPEIDWGPIGVEPGAAHSLRQCHGFRSMSPDGALCEGSVACVPRPYGPNGHTVSRVLSLLREPNVQAALERHAYFGRRSAEEIGIQLTVGTGSMTINIARCDGSPDCEEPDSQILWLRDQLNGIVLQQRERCR